MGATGPGAWRRLSSLEDDAVSSEGATICGEAREAGSCGLMEGQTGDPRSKVALASSVVGLPGDAACQ